MKIVFTIEIKRTPKPKTKKSPTPQKPTAQSQSPKNTVIINQK